MEERNEFGGGDGEKTKAERIFVGDKNWTGNNREG